MNAATSYIYHKCKCGRVVEGQHWRMYLINHASIKSQASGVSARVRVGEREIDSARERSRKKDS